jgi:group I intron endonuclease
MNCGIYRIYNNENNKSYIGSSINLKNREYKHFWLLSKKIHDNIHLQKSFTKYGKDSFVFEILELCEESLLFERENYYIKIYDSCNQTFGYNKAEVNEFRRNNLNNTTKRKLSINNLIKNNNFKRFLLTNIINDDSHIFDNLFDAASYLINNNFSNGSNRNVRQKISSALRGKKINNGSKGSVRQTIYKHKFQIIN